MDIFRLGNILNALKFNKRVEPAQKASQREEVPSSSGAEYSGEDSVTISDEAFYQSSIESVAGEIESRSEEIREDRVSEIKEKISRGEYNVPPQDVTNRIVEGPDIYEQLK